MIANLAASTVVLSPSLRDNTELCLTAGTSSSNPGTLALTTLALARLGLWYKAELALRQLMTLAVVESDVVHWGKPGTRPLFNLSNCFKNCCLSAEVFVWLTHAVYLHWLDSFKHFYRNIFRFFYAILLVFHKNDKCKS